MSQILLAIIILGASLSACHHQQVMAADSSSKTTSPIPSLKSTPSTTIVIKTPKGKVSVDATTAESFALLDRASRYRPVDLDIVGHMASLKNPRGPLACYQGRAEDLCGIVGRMISNGTSAARQAKDGTSQLISCRVIAGYASSFAQVSYTLSEASKPYTIQASTNIDICR